MRKALFVGIFVLLFGSVLASAEPNLLLHCKFDDSLTCEDGETPSLANGLTFAPGILNNGVLIDGSDSLDYLTTGNFNKDTGTIEFWVKLNWNGNTGQQFYFFDIFDRYDADKTWSRFDIRGNPILFFDIHNVAPDNAVYYDSTLFQNWKAGELHFLAMTWDLTTELRAYVDGEFIGSVPLGFSMPGISDMMSLGYYKDINIAQMNGVMDELKIYDGVKSDEEIMNDYLSYGAHYCGDGTCNEDENYITCSEDCSAPSQDYYTKQEVDSMINNLQGQIDDVKESQLEQNNILEDLRDSFEAFVEKVMRFFGYLPYSLRKDIVCNSMRYEGMNTTTDLGLSCKMIEQKKQTCNCEPI